MTGQADAWGERVLGINSATAAWAREAAIGLAVFGIYMAVSLVVNVVAVVGLLTGRQMRGRLLEGLLRMYADTQVDRYYDPALVTGYSRRYGLFVLAIIVLALASAIVPLLILTMGA